MSQAGEASLPKRLVIRITQSDGKLVATHQGSGFREVILSDSPITGGSDGEAWEVASQFGDPLTAKHFGDHIIATYALQ